MNDPDLVRTKISEVPAPLTPMLQEPINLASRSSTPTVIAANNDEDGGAIG